MVDTGSSLVIRDSLTQQSSAFVGSIVIATEKTSLSLEDTSIVNNSHDYGAVVLVQSQLEASRIRCVGNHARGKGGVFFTAETIANFYNSSFESNSADGDCGVFCAEGGAVTISNSQFENNKAASGAVANVRVSEEDDITLLVSDSVFRDNAASDTGGCFSISTAGKVKTQRSIFQGNSAEMVGCFVLRAHFFFLTLSFSRGVGRAVLFSLARRRPSLLSTTCSCRIAPSLAAEVCLSAREWTRSWRSVRVLKETLASLERAVQSTQRAWLKCM